MKPVVFAGHSRPIKDIQFNFEDDLLFTASNDRYVTLWSTETNERIGTYYHDAAINCMTVTPDSKYLVTGDNSGYIYIWDVNTGKALNVIESGYPSPTSSLDLGVSDRQICVSFNCRSKSDRSKVLIFDIEEALKLKTEVNPETKQPMSLLKSIPLLNSFESNTDHKIVISRFLNSNKNVLCAFDNGLVEVRKVGGEILNSKKLHSNLIKDLNLSFREELALTSSKDGQSILFDPETLDILNVFKPDNPVRNINAGKISPLFNPDLPEKNQLRHCFIGGGQDSKDVTFTKSTEGGFEILIYDMITGEEVGSISGHFSPINALAISNSGKIIVSGGEEATVRLHTLSEDYYQLKNN